MAFGAVSPPAFILEFVRENTLLTSHMFDVIFPVLSIFFLFLMSGYEEIEQSCCCTAIFSESQYDLHFSLHIVFLQVSLMNKGSCGSCAFFPLTCSIQLYKYANRVLIHFSG